MDRKVLIASAVAAVLTAPGLVPSARAGGDWAPQQIDEKCYGVSAKDLAACGSDCAAIAADKREPGEVGNKIFRDSDGNTYGFVPKGTCVKIYHGSLTPKST